MAEKQGALSIRPYEDSDWPSARLIHDLARPIELKGSCDPGAFIPLADDAADLKEFQDCQKLVACLENRVVGFVGIDHSEIGWLYVHPEASRKGVGRALLRKGLAYIGSGADVHVLEGNKPALALYLSEGFAVVHRFTDEINGYACIVLKLSR